MYQFREKVVVSMPNGKEIEGYVFAVLNSKELYVILTGDNTRPVLVEAASVRSLDVLPTKRKRGRPRKEIK